MKKKTLLMPFFVLFALFFLAGCVKKPDITAKEAGKLVVEEYIYQNHQEKFRENFKESKYLQQSMLDSRQEFFQAFENSVNSQEFSKEDSEKLVTLLEKSLKEKTSYQIKVTKETKEKANIIYEVKGLSYASVLSATLEEYLKAAKADVNLLKDDKKTTAFIMEELPQKIAEMKPKEEITAIPLEMTIEKGKWVLEKSTSKDLSRLFLGFVAGVQSQEEFQQQMKETFRVINDELIEELGKNK